MAILSQFVCPTSLLYIKCQLIVALIYAYYGVGNGHKLAMRVTSIVSVSSIFLRAI